MRHRHAHGAARAVQQCRPDVGRRLDAVTVTTEEERELAEQAASAVEGIARETGRLDTEVDAMASAVEKVQTQAQQLVERVRRFRVE